jgi:transglutaminase-like putative cysteine protease
MTKNILFSLLIVFLSLNNSELFSQYKLSFGDISLSDLSNKTYKPDPGADAVIISDVGMASFNYVNGFYVELERDVRIRIVNSNGFDYANIEIPFSSDDRISYCRASTFNTMNGVKAETKILKKNFLIEKTSNSERTLKFNFPDVHEGSVIEYSYIIRLTGSSIYTLVPWKFQSDIPTGYSSLTISYPEACAYKSTISGSGRDVKTNSARTQTFILGELGTVITSSWSVQNMPAFREEPYIKSKKEHLTKISFELASFDFPGSNYKEITPTYANLTTKLLDREDFGKPINTNFKSLAERITVGLTDNLSKLKKIHAYISSNILWNGENDFTSSGSLRSVLKKEKGNSADINMLLIAMLRSLNIKADPVILSTRSNGSLNQYSAMIQQFNYLLASVTIDDKIYLVDATDPLRPFNILPFDCLNDAGRLISEQESKFVTLENNERQVVSKSLILNLDGSGNITGTMENRYKDYSAFNIRKKIRLESEEGYLDIIKSLSANISISDFNIKNISNPDSDLVERYDISISNGEQIAGNEIIINPYFSLLVEKNPFTSYDRKFPVDFGCPQMGLYSVKLTIPDGYSVTEKPADISFNIGKDDGKFEYVCKQTGNEIVITSLINIKKTIFQLSEYMVIRDFYSKILQKQSELIVLKKNAVI